MESLLEVSGDFLTVPETLGDFSGSRGRRARKTISRLSRHFGPLQGPREPCKAVRGGLEQKTRVLKML